MLKEANWNLPVPVPNLLTLYSVFFNYLDPDPYPIQNTNPEGHRIRIQCGSGTMTTSIKYYFKNYTKYIKTKWSMVQEIRHFIFVLWGQILQNSDIPVPWSKRSKQVFGTGTVPFYFEQCCGVGRSRYFWPEPVGGSGSGSNLDEKKQKKFWMIFSSFVPTMIKY